VSTHPTIHAENDYNKILDHAFEKPVAYIIRKNGSDYEAINGSTGKIDYGGSDDVGEVDGADDEAVCQAVNDILTSGGTVILKEFEKPAGLSISANRMFIVHYQGSVKIYTSTASGKIGNTPQAVSDTFVLQNNTNEQDLLELTPTTITHLYNTYIDLNALTQNCTIKIYSKIDDTNYRIIPSMTLSGIPASQRKGLLLKDLWINTDFKITIQSAIAEGATRNIPYRYFKEEY